MGTPTSGVESLGCPTSPRHGVENTGLNCTNVAERPSKRLSAFAGTQLTQPIRARSLVDQPPTSRLSDGCRWVPILLRMVYAGDLYATVEHLYSVDRAAKAH